VRVQVDPIAVERLHEDESVAALLHGVAQSVEGRVRAPSRMAITTRAGVGRRGAYAQVRMTGPGAIVEEFGSRTRAPSAPLRNALRGGR